MMPKLTLHMEDRSGVVTEFTLDHNLTTPVVVETAPKIDQAIRALVMWKEWSKSFLKHRIEDMASARVVEEKRENYRKEQDEFEKNKHKEQT